MSDRRFERSWQTWQEACSRGPAARDTFLNATTESTLIQALASEGASKDPVARNVLATALLNRSGAATPRGMAKRMTESLTRVHAAEQAARRTDMRLMGSRELGSTSRAAQAAAYAKRAYKQGLPDARGER